MNSAIENRLNVLAEKRARGEIETFNPIEKAKKNVRSMRCAINGMCYDCQGGSESCAPDPGWKWAIGNCTMLACPLHNFRPYQNKACKPGEGVYKEYYGNGSEP